MRKILIAVVVNLLLISQASLAANDILKPGHPDRYLVQQGDTLWDISSMFLTQAWRWPEIWRVNPEIENPHLIYPGDEIMLRYIDGEPQLLLSRGDEARTVRLTPIPNRDVKASPRIRSEPLTSSIPAIPLDAIAGLLNAGRIVEAQTLDQAPYILANKSERLIFGPGDQFYARGEWAKDTTVYGVFRSGQIYQDPETKEILGYEAQELGVATVLQRDDDIVTMSLGAVKADVRLGDRLLPTEERRVESMFYPAAPATAISGAIMTIVGNATQVGKNHVVTVNRGVRSGLAVGNVLAIFKQGAIVRDKVAGDQVRMPAERVGLLMVFRVFDKMSYGLVLESKEPVRVGDLLQNP
ncbi:LysM peptidoglycan-binding domain-containing protein [Pseudomonadales bacterium]|nr:LysM peptidoglycan-binding domain-containing protein [Pseudomonadales bacterium]MDA9298018.1 LysM peptidoglycan-binding domain-containing protein [Pseudomonadales bacterium]MDB9917576.1 LysM peptidoglycan-binding domain-containing protein [Pseudomonadales bacterium]